MYICNLSEKLNCGEADQHRIKKTAARMGNSLRCFLACVLPCGALDIVRVVHLDGQVEEYTRQVTAGEVMATNPDHVISKPCSQGVSHKILILSPESDLKRGSIYFLIPESSLPRRRSKEKDLKKFKKKVPDRNTGPDVAGEASRPDDCCTKAAPPEKKAGHRRRRSGPVAAWRPRLESISEDQ